MVVVIIVVVVVVVGVVLAVVVAGFVNNGVNVVIMSFRCGCMVGVKFGGCCY